MKNLKNALLLFILVAIFGACKEPLMGPEEINDPENNFELLWNDLNNHYGLFRARGWDWQARYDEFRPKVTPTTTDEELRTIMSDMLETLDDSHTWIENRGEWGFISGFEKNAEAKEIFDLDVIADNYVENFEIQSEPNSTIFATGKINEDIGYIYLKGFGDYDFNLIDEVMEDMKNRASIVIDLRSNGGGDNSYRDHISSKFVNEKLVYATMRGKIGPGPNDFTEPEELMTTPGVDPYLKPVIVLSDRATISAAEDFLLIMKLFDHVTHIGDITAGDFSDTSLIRFLPNGWEFGYSTREYRLTDGSFIDGIGHQPDIHVKNNIEDVQLGTDEVVETAIQYLFDEYGIQ